MHEQGYLRAVGIGCPFQGIAGMDDEVRQTVLFCEVSRLREQTGIEIDSMKIHSVQRAAGPLAKKPRAIGQFPRNAAWCAQDIQ